ncbi:MAG TPA: hypothetical protein DCE80_00300 [Ignavibacteriales bacterium]|nr:hypothetical protein [Ignavibacteriales bacterium]
MITSKEELIEQLKDNKLLEHRHNNVELKSDWTKNYGDKISGYGNKRDTRNTWLVIGVDDAGDFTEKTEAWARNTEQAISQHMNTFLDPIQTCQGIECCEINNKWIIIIRIKNPGSVVYWEKEAYKASGTTISKMTPEEIMKMTIDLPGLTDYSKQPWDGIINESLTRLFISNIAEKKEELKNQDISDIDKILEYVQIKNRNVCRILFGNCKYRVVFYNGDNEPVKNDQRYGLYGILDNTFLNEIQDWTMKQLCKLEHVFPNRALKEGLANAVAHAAYFANDGDIIIEVFCDKVVISNLCIPECGHFANKWFSRIHKTVNAVLMETLRWADKVDELGRGKSLIFSDSIKNGNKMPFVGMENAGRYNRWRLTIYGCSVEIRYKKLLRKIMTLYKNEQKALIAYALVLWRDQKVSVIRDYVDDESRQLFAEVLGDIDGPIFFYQKEDKIFPTRWVKVLLEEGQDSKTLTMSEEIQLFKWVSKIRIENHKGLITPKDLRKLADMGNSQSANVQSSGLLKKWVEEGKLKKVKKGTYQFVYKEPSPTFAELLAILSSDKKSTDDNF